MAQEFTVCISVKPNTVTNPLESRTTGASPQHCIRHDGVTQTPILSSPEDSSQINSKLRLVYELPETCAELGVSVGSTQMSVVAEELRQATGVRQQHVLVLNTADLAGSSLVEISQGSSGVAAGATSVSLSCTDGISKSCRAHQFDLTAVLDR